MPVIQAAGALLDQILDQTFPVWGEGLSRHGYGQWNRAQELTAWGRGHLRRFALVDDSGRLLASAKRYDLTLRVDGKIVPTLGIGAVFTPLSERGRGHAHALIAALEEAARRDGARAALLFSEIGASYYERFGFTTVPVQTMDVEVLRKDGAPAMLVRAGEDRDAANVAAMQVARGESFRLALVPDETQVIYAVARKRLFVGLDPGRRRAIEYFVAEEGCQAVAYVVLYVSRGKAGLTEDWSLESCGDRDPSGARVGAMLQVLLARTPSAAPPLIRGWWPTSLRPPQLRLIERPPAREVMMLKPLVTDVAMPSLGASDVMYWHGDAF